MTSRVLHIVESIDRGAVENWLVRMYAFEVQGTHPPDWTFYCILPEEGRRERELRDLGARVVRSPVDLRDTRRFVRRLRRFLRESDFDVLHCHHDVLSGVYLTAAFALPLRRRIVHIHNADLSLPTPSRVKSLVLRPILRQICFWQADVIVGISVHTLESFVGERTPQSSWRRVVYYGVDTAPFRLSEGTRERTRASLGIGGAATVLLFVGRMTWFKNPLFVLDVLAHVLAFDPHAVAVFVGAGPLTEDVAAQAKERGLARNVRMLGWRDDTPAIMQAADILVFPRREAVSGEIGKEGLGLIVVEAQAAGLPVVVSDSIPDEAFAIPELCTVCLLAAGPEAWALAIRAAVARPRPSVSESSGRIDMSRFSMRTAAASLAALHNL